MQKDPGSKVILNYIILFKTNLSYTNPTLKKKGRGRGREKEDKGGGEER